MTQHAARRVTLLVSTTGWGGTEEVTIGLLESLETSGHATALIDLHANVYERPLRDSGLGTRYRHLPIAGRLKTLSAERYAAALRSVDTEVCVLSKGAFSVRARPIDTAARAASQRYVTIEHLSLGPLPRHVVHVGGRPLSWNPSWYYRRHGIRTHLAAPDLVVCVSRAVRERLVAEFGDAFRSRVIHNGIDTHAFTFDADGRRRAGAAWHIPADAFVFGFLGRLAPVKAPEIALRQFANVRARPEEPSAWLVMAGDGPDRARLEALAASLGVADRVRFTGWIAREARAEAMSAFDAFLMPSRSEGLPLTLLEAMALARPCIAFDVGGVGEALSDRELGCLVPAGDEGAFGRAMERIHETPLSEREAMGARARSRVEQYFQRDVQIGRLAAAVLGQDDSAATGGATT